MLMQDMKDAFNQQIVGLHPMNYSLKQAVLG